MTLSMWLFIAAIWWYLGRLAVWCLVRRDGIEGLKRHWLDLHVNWTDDPALVLEEIPECPALFGTDAYWRARGKYWLERAEQEAIPWSRRVAPMFGPLVFIRCLVHHRA